MTDQQKIDQAHSLAFARQAIAEFNPPPLLVSAPQKAKALFYASYVPNVISFASAMFLVIWLTSGYSLYVRIFLGVIFASVFIGNEAAKRWSLKSSIKKSLAGQKVSIGLSIGIAIFFLVSQVSSYIGGNKLVVENSSPPVLAANPKIAELESTLEVTRKSIAIQEGTTWKGRVTVDANRNLKTLYVQEESLINQIAALEAEDKANQASSDVSHQAKISNLGIATGLIAVLCDFVLYFLMRMNLKLLYNVNIVAGGIRSKSTQSSSTALNAVPGVANIPQANFNQDKDEDSIAAELDESLEASSLSDGGNSVENVFNGLLSGLSFSREELIKILKKGAQSTRAGFERRKSAHCVSTAQRHRQLEDKMNALLQAM